MKFKLTIGRKIGLGFGGILLLTIIAFGLTQETLVKSKKKVDQVTQIYNPSLRALEELKLKITESNMLISKWVYEQTKEDDPDKVKLLRIVKEEYPQIKKKVGHFSKYWDSQEQLAISRIFEDIRQLFDYYNTIFTNLNSFKSYEEEINVFQSKYLLEDGDIEFKTTAVLESLKFLINHQEQKTKKVNDDMLNSFNVLESVVIYVGITLLLGGLLIAILTANSIVRPVQRLKNMLILMRQGIMPSDRIRGSSDEIGDMSDALNGLVESMTLTTEFAYEVGSGNFSYDYKPLSEQDTLGHALLKMRDDLWENERMLEKKVEERTEEVVRQKEEIETQNKKLEVLYKHITDSIRYAKRLQEAILPSDSFMNKLLPNSFVFYKPKDIVSGDFYWVYKKGEKVLFAAIDCTGHGVPGAFMSIVAYNQLKHVVTTTSLTSPSEILDELNKGLAQTLNSGHDEPATKDGMDLSLCSIDYKNMELEYSGAFNPLYLFRDGKLIQYKADKFPIGYFENDKENRFTNHKIELKVGDFIYIFSDGFADQFGGPGGKKFMANSFRNLLHRIHNFPLEKQKNILAKTFDDWRGSLEQVDDIVIMGVKIE